MEWNNICGEQFDGRVNINCSKCKSEEIVIGIDDHGYFWVAECNKCHYKGKQK